MRNENRSAQVGVDELSRPARSQPGHSSALPTALLAFDAAFNAVFDSSGEALIIIDSAGAIQKANRRARELFRVNDASGHHPGLSDILSGPPIDQLMSFWAEPDSSPRARSLDGSLASGFPIRITLRTILPGSQHLLLCMEDGSIVQRADAKWRHLEAELHSVLDSVQVGVILLDVSGRIRLSNARFGQLFGLTARELREMESFEELQQLIAARFRDPNAFFAPWKSYASDEGGPGHDELELTRPAPRVLERFSRPVLDAEGRPMGWFELYSDVTEERQIQSKMLQTEKMAALGQLVSGIAHELNNPLTAIMGYAQLLLGRGLDPARRSEALKVFQEAERARRIVKNLLYFARENKPERTRVDINEIVERTLALRSYELKIENIVVQRELAQGLPLTMADPYQIQQVVLNLVVNAEQALLEARGQGHVRIRTSHSIPQTGHREEEKILLEISDDGPGIPPEIASRIFDPFFTTKPPGVGTGLGLSIVYGIVQQHGGEVTFESHPDVGTKFVVEFPVTPVPAAEDKATLPPPARPLGSVPSGRILVVEDEPTVAQLIVDVLCEEGHRAEAVLDSQEGLTRLSRGEYDLVICDLRMPRLDGPAFYEALVRARSPITKKISLHHRGHSGAAHSRVSQAGGFAVPRQTISGRRIEAGGKRHARLRLERSVQYRCAGLDEKLGRRLEDLRAMNGTVPAVMALPERSVLLGISDVAVAQGLAREVERFAGAGHTAIVSTLLRLHQISSRIAPDVIFLDFELLDGASPAVSVRQLRAVAPVILLAPLEEQARVAHLVAAGDIEFVARTGDFIPLAAGLIERKMRWAEMSESVLGTSWAELPVDIGSIFRHEINNPLTGILGNAELLLAHRERLTFIDTQRLQTVVDLAVRLRETIRRLSDAWGNQPPSMKSA